MPPAAPSITSQSFGRTTHAGTHGAQFSFVPRHDNRHDGHHNGNGRFVSPIYSGYYYPYYYGAPVYYDDSSALPGAGTFDNGQGYYDDSYEGTAPTVFENRPPSQMYYRPNAGENSVLDGNRYGDRYTDSRDNARSAAPPQNQVMSTNGNENNDTTTVLIFKDGMKREVTNYAIMGQYIFVFSGDRRKIPLSEIDVDATVKANEDRGNEFKIPSSAKPS